MLRTVATRILSNAASIFLLATVLAAGILSSSNLNAQIRSGRAVPGDEYYSGFRSFYSGDYRNAMRAFRGAARSGVKTPDRRWVDAVCYETMMGECYFHQGDLKQALISYDTAINIFLANTDWIQRLKFPNQIQPKQPQIINWGPSGRKTLIGNFPDTILSEQGIFNLTKINNQDAIIQQKEMYKIGGIEIFRCTALALARRYELLGPLSPHDPLSSKIERRLAQRSLPPDHWAQKLLEVQLGLAKLGAGFDDDALRILNGALTAGQLDHPLTSRALLEIGKISLNKNQLELAFRSFYEATFPAAQFDLLDELEEAIVLANTVHRLSNSKEPLALLDQATLWARAKNYDRLHSALLVTMAENAALVGNTKQAAGNLQMARRAMGRSDLSNGDLGAKFNYLTALLHYQTNKPSAAKPVLDLVMKYQTRGSQQLFKIANVYESAKSRDKAALSPRIANALFANVLRVPDARDWRLNPMEALTVQATSHLDELDFWMQIAMERKEINRVVEIADRIRRKKFYATLPMNGRVMALRWTLHGPAAWLDEATALQRQNLFARFPDYAEKTQQVERLKEAIARLDLIPEQGDAVTKWKDLAKKLENVSEQQEQKLLEIALHPEPASLEFPPLRTIDQIQSGLQPGQAVLDIIVTKTQTHFVLIASGKDYESWSLNQPALIRSSIVEVLRSFGNYSKDKPVTAANLASDDWKTQSSKLYATLFPNKNAGFWNSIDELIVVPDGPFWYLPFEALPVGTEPLISTAKVRYVPTTGLSVNDTRRQPTNPTTVIVQGRLYNNRQMDKVIGDAATAISGLSPQSKVLSKFLPIGSAIVGHRWDRLVVLDDIEGIDGENYGWSPAQADGKGPGTKLQDWMKLPFGVPEQLILPGYHTAAESGGKDQSTGDEMLNSTLAMMASGSRTILISRWRTGGQTSLDIVREFLSQLPQQGASASLQRSVQLIRSEAIVPANEPRVKGIDDDQLPKGEHPFFWAGIQLLDLGQPLNP